MLLDLCVSADRAVWHPPHTGGKPGLFQEPRRNPERDGLSAGEDWIRTSSTRAREVGCRAPKAAKSNGSTTLLSMRIGDLRSARTPAPGQEGKDIIVLDRWAEDRTEVVSSLARSRPVSVL